MTALLSLSRPFHAVSSAMRRLAAACSTLATLACVATYATAQVNGGFEANNFGSWTTSYSTYVGAGTFAPPVFLLPLPFAHPAPAVINSGSPLVPCQPIAIPPYEGTYMAQINDLTGGAHATRLEQSFSPTAANLAKGILTGQVGVMLVNPGHFDADQPGFEGELLINSNTYGKVRITATQAVAQGWQLVGSCVGEPVYYKRFKFCINLKHLHTTDTITARLTVWDCSLGYHGAMLWADGLKWEDCTTPPSDMVGWWYETPKYPNLVVRDLAGPPYNDGTVVMNGPAIPPPCSKVGNALAHYGWNYVAVPDHNDLDFTPYQDFSIDLWAKPEIQVNRMDPMVCKLTHSTNTFGDGWFFYLDNGYPTLLLTSGGFSSLHQDTTVKVPIAEWTHLAVTVDRMPGGGGVVKFYFNGDLLGGAYPPPLGGNLSNPEELRLGGPPLGNTYNSYFDIFSGCTDEIELFRRVLTAEEVMRVAANCKGKCKPRTIIFTGGTGGVGVSGTVAAGHIFDLHVAALEPVSFEAISVRPYGFTGPFDVSVYVTPNTYVGKTTNPAAWLLVGTGSGVSAGGTTTTSQLAECVMNTPFNLLPGDYGVAVYLRNPSGTTSVAYTTYPTAPANMPPWSDADLTIVPSPATAPGVASSGLFGFSSPGLWNGALHYRKASIEAQPGFCFFGSGCPAANGEICRQVLLAPALLGGTASAAITNTQPMGLGIQAIGLSGTTSPFGPLPFDLAAYGAPGCQLRVSPDLTQFLIGGATGLSWTLGIPNSPAFQGMPFFSQVLVLDPAANALGIVTSDANQLIVGR